MGVSTRLRYEVLRRDFYSCRYCGATAPYTPLVVDHVTPRKLGGLDVLENLVTACQSCNNGKSAVPPEWWLVTEVGNTAREWRGEDGPESDDDDEDDYAEVHAYQDAFCVLSELSADEALSYVAKAFAVAPSYRPTLSEAIRCAGMMARRAAREATVALAPAADEGD